MTFDWKPYLRSFLHIVATALVSVLIAVLQAWLAQHASHPVPEASPEISGAVAVCLATIRRLT